MKFKSLISKLLITAVTVSVVSSTIPSKKAYADSFISVTVGANLTEEQKQQMLKEFGVTKDTANIMQVTKDEEVKYLGKVATKQQIGTKSISCSYVEPTSEGGIVVETKNLTWVTSDMIKNALITAGVENAKVKAIAPFAVSGTAALTGILKGFENSSTGQKIDEDKKEAANEEIMVTGQLADSIAKDNENTDQKQAQAEATSVINEVKKEVIKEKPKTEKEVEKIVINITNNYNSTSNLSDKDIDKITNLMVKINKLELDYKSLKDQLDDVSNNFKETLDKQAKGFFDKVSDFFSNLWDSIKSFFSSKDAEKDKAPVDEEEKPLLDENGNLNNPEEGKDLGLTSSNNTSNKETTNNKNDKTNNKDNSTSNTTESSKNNSDSENSSNETSSDNNAKQE